jgi:hypothetical protein
MTDREMLLTLCEHLGLSVADDRQSLSSNTYVIEGDSILIGEGEGYGGFFVSFTFDAQGNIDSHGVWE